MNIKSFSHYSIIVFKSAAVPAVFLIVILYYIVTYALMVQTGITFEPSDRGWVVTDIDTCDDKPTWCQQRGDLREGDILLRVGRLAYGEMLADRRLVPFSEYGPGDRVDLLIYRNGKVVSSVWQMPPSDKLWQHVRLLVAIAPLSTWAAAAALWVIVPTRERDRKWSLMVLTFSVYSVWIAAGIVSRSLVASSSLLVHALSWVLLPLVVHLHWMAPTKLADISRYVWLAFYGVASVFAAMELTQSLGNQLFYLPLFIQIIASGLILFWRLASDVRKWETILMMAGWGVTFSPGLAWIAARFLFDVNHSVSAYVITLSLVILPLFYLYANYRHALGKLEFRARQTVSLLSFICLGLNVIGIVLALIGTAHMWTTRTSGLVVMGASIIIVVVPVSYLKFSGFISLLLTGRVDESLDRVFVMFSERLVTATDMTDLNDIVAEVFSLLDVSGMALYLFDDGGNGVLQYGSSHDTPSMLSSDICTGIMEARSYELEHIVPKLLLWTKIVLPLAVQKKAVGLWLIGRYKWSGTYSEAQLSKLNNLAHGIAAVVEVIQQRELLQEQWSAIVRQEKMASLGRMAASLAHQVNNPLQIIQGSLEAFSGHNYGGPKDRWLRMAYEQALFLAEVVRSITRFAHPNNDHEDYVWIDVNEAVQEALLLTREKTRQNQIEVAANLGADVPDVRMLPSDLTQVITILVDNACDAMREGGHLHIKTAVNGSNGSRDCVVSVSDTGEGIPDAHRMELFEPFFTTKTNGMGFGLAICYSIIERGYGDISVESNIGSGSTFTIRLPTQS